MPKKIKIREIRYIHQGPANGIGWQAYIYTKDGDIKILKDISNKDIINLNIPTGFPYIFEFDNNLDVKKDYFLGNQEKILKKIENVSRQGQSEN